MKWEHTTEIVQRGAAYSVALAVFATGDYFLGLGWACAVLAALCIVVAVVADIRRGKAKR